VFGTVCTPENPIGSCMVSSEGACAAHYTYGRFKDAAIVARAAVPAEAAS
jgi:hydrogenase expression/formation protein HypD